MPRGNPTAPRPRPNRQGRGFQNTRRRCRRSPPPDAVRPFSAHEKQPRIRENEAMIFDGFVHQLPDIDPGETKEWLDSLQAVGEIAGKTRARYLISKVPERCPGPHA